MKFRQRIYEPYGTLTSFVGRVLNPVWRLRVGDSDLGWKVETAIQHLLFGSSRNERVLTLTFNADMIIPADYSSINIIQYGSGQYEPETVHLFHRLCQPGTSVVDVGAHLGYYTLLAARLVGPTGRVYAFEADPYYQRFLEKSVALNGFDRVTVTGKAVAESVGTGLLFPDHWSGGGSLLVRPSASMDSVDIGTTSLDDFFQRHGWPSVELIKVDVEGSEPKVLQGMEELSSRNPGLKLVIEFNGRLLLKAGLRDSEYFSWLERLGFRYVQVIGDRRCVPVHRHADLDLWSKRGFSANLFCTKDAMDAGE